VIVAAIGENVMTSF